MESNKHRAAFDLVCPAKHAAALAAVGYITPEAAAQKSWRDPIAALVTVEEMEAAGVDLVDVVDAIVFYTATTPKVQVAKAVAGTPFFSYLPGCKPRGFLIMAEGYRRGPAGP